MSICIMMLPRFLPLAFTVLIFGSCSSTPSDPEPTDDETSDDAPDDDVGGAGGLEMPDDGGRGGTEVVAGRGGAGAGGGGGAAGQAGSGGASGGGGTAGVAGRGGAGGSAGAGGNAGTGGSAGAGGNAGTDGSGGTSAPAGTPVQRWGQLQVCGTKLCDKNGSPVQLKGVSSMWLNWENTGYAQNQMALRFMRDTWKVSVIRAAMGIEPAGAYLANPARAKGAVEAIIKNAIAEGVYVIVDWHDHNAQSHQSQAVAFFSEMASKYGAAPNLIWEPYNEPLQVSWTNVLKPYHQAVVSAIRQVDPDNVVILGTPQWSQRVDQAAADPLSGTNLMYTLHFYSCTHAAAIRNFGATAVSRGVAVFVTEWGATHADGGLDGIVCEEEGQRWHDWMDSNGIGWTAWKLDDCTPDSSCLLKPGAPVSGPWDDAWLRGHATFVRARLLD